MGDDAARRSRSCRPDADQASEATRLANTLKKYPLYTDKAPPERGDLVVLRTTRLSQEGIYANAVEWCGDQDNVIAYLRPGAIARKRKEQRQFIGAAKKYSEHLFAARVEDAQEISRSGVEDTGLSFYQLTVERITMTTEDEAFALDRWRQALRSAKLIDLTAHSIGRDPLELRRRLLYSKYEASQQLPNIQHTILQAQYRHTTAIELCGGDDDLASALVNICLADAPKKSTRYTQLAQLNGSAAAVRAAAQAVDPTVAVTVQSPPVYTLSLFSKNADTAYQQLDAALAAATAAAAAFKTEAHVPNIQESHNTNHIQPTISIGMLGAVANGKSSLVRALSTEVTQRHSAEHAHHGATIRLGYANALVQRCAECGVYFSDHASSSTRICPSCGSTHGSERRLLSFVDCPGHDELLRVMISGASSFDAAILVVAANEIGLPQEARTHLTALRGLGLDSKLKGRVAIALSKSELLVVGAKHKDEEASNILRARALEVRKAVRGTCAEDAPIFPIAATRGFGLDALCAWLTTLDTVSTTTGIARMHVLRSFDINKPGKSARTVKGGVVGGSVTCGEFARGELIEIRPGSQSRTSVTPLFGYIEDIKSGELQIDHAARGGLIALQTSLDPGSFGANRLAGNLVGLVGTLPPVFRTLCCDHLQSLDPIGIDEEKDSSDESVQDGSIDVYADRILKKKDVVRIYAGPSSVVGRVYRVQKDRVQFDLKQNFCLDIGTHLAIEKKINKKPCLIATAVLVDGDMCDIDLSSMPKDAASPATCSNEAHLPAEVSEAPHDEGEEEQWFCNLELVIDRFLDRLGALSWGAKRIALPPLTLLRDGGLHIIWTNFAEIFTALNRPSQMFITFIQLEFGITSFATADGGLRLGWRGRGLRERLEAALRRFSRTYIVCGEKGCRSAHTQLSRASNIAAVKHSRIELVCLECSSRRWIERNKK